jgi:hypothetical protein
MAESGLSGKVGSGAGWPLCDWVGWEAVGPLQAALDERRTFDDLSLGELGRMICPP